MKKIIKNKENLRDIKKYRIMIDVRVEAKKNVRIVIIIFF